MIYLLHFSRRYEHGKQPGHYLGFTEDLQARLDQHAAGNGARLIQVITDAGIGFELARTWPGGRDEERRLKNIRDAAAMCPLCGVWPVKGADMSRGGYSTVARAINERYAPQPAVDRRQVHRWDSKRSRNMAGHEPPEPVELRPDARRTTPKRIFETEPWLAWYGEGTRGPRRKGWVVHVPVNPAVETVESELVK